MEASISKLRRNSSLFIVEGDEEEIRVSNNYHEHQTDLKGRSLRSIRRIRQEKQDQDLLHRTLMDACQYAYGTQMVEVWVWDSVLSKLSRPEGGWWIDPYWHSKDMILFCQFVDTQRHDYIAPPALSPGVGVPGVLWSDLKGRQQGRSQHHHHRRKVSGDGGGSGTLLDNTFLNQIFDVDHQHSSASRIAWRDLKALANDPDQPPNRRLDVLASSDLRWTGGVPFSIQGQEGIVVYYVRDGTNLQKLQDPINTAYLITASDFVGSCLALRIPRRNAVTRRQVEVDRNLRKVKCALKFLIRQGVDLESIMACKSYKQQQQPSVQAGKPQLKSSLVTNQPSSNNNNNNNHDKNETAAITETKEKPLVAQVCSFVQRKAKQSITKFKGAGTKAPPSFTWGMAGFTVVGALITIVSVSAFNELMVALAGDHYSMPVAPMGALVALQFGLTAAPAAQPRTIMVGQVISILIALAFGEMRLSHNQWIQQCLACAIAIGAMSKMGVVNPPAAATAFVFSNGSYKFTNMLTALVGNWIAILCAVLVNNLSDNRHYPTFWGIPQILLSQENIQNLTDDDRDDTVTVLLRRARQLKRLTSQLSFNLSVDRGASSAKQSNDQAAAQASWSEPAEGTDDTKEVKADLENSASFARWMESNENDEEMVSKPSVRYADSVDLSVDGSDRYQTIRQAKDGMTRPRR